MKPRKLLDRSALMEYAGNSLAARAQSLSELRTKLRQKAENKDDVDSVLAYLKEAGFVNDHRFAGLYADWRRENQGLGRARVLRDLMARRVAPEVARQAVDQSFAESNEVEMIEAFLARKYRGKDLGALLQEEKNLASAFRRLRTAGFSAGNSIRVLKRYAAQAEALEDQPEEDA